MRALMVDTWFSEVCCLRVFVFMLCSCCLCVLVFMLPMCDHVAYLFLCCVCVHDSVNIVYEDFRLTPLVPHLCHKKCGTLGVFSICAQSVAKKCGTSRKTQVLRLPLFCDGG